jgi:hypothetical protein
MLSDEIKECNMYKLGFCIYGPQCRYKHKPAPGEWVCSQMLQGRVALSEEEALECSDRLRTSIFSHRAGSLRGMLDLLTSSHCF